MRPIDRQLIKACQNGDALTVEQLLQQGANPNAKDDLLPCPASLLIAAENGHIPIIQLLVQYGANPRITSGYNRRHALHYAVENLRYEAAEYLLTKLQLDPNAKDGHKITPLMIAAREGDIHLLKLLAQHGADPHATDFEGKTALHYAVGRKNYDAAQYLLTQLQINPNAKDNNGYTPLMIAAEYGDIHMLKLLVQHGADPCITHPTGQTALHYAVRNNKYDAAQYLLTQLQINPNAEDRDGITPLMIAAENGDIHILQLLVQHGADPCTTDPEGQTALYHALENRNTDVAQYLITELKLDPNTPDRDGVTPFMIATKNCNIRILKLLIQHGADPYIRDCCGQSSLHYAIEYQNYDAVQYLLTQLQLDPNIQDDDGITPFLLAAQNGDIHMLKLLIQHGANPYATDAEGRTAIHYAVGNHRYDIFEYLITYLHLDPNAKNHYGNTPLHIALRSGDYDTAQTLIQLGANLHIPNDQGKTPSSISSLYQIRLQKPQPSTITL